MQQRKRDSHLLWETRASIIGGATGNVIAAQIPIEQLAKARM